MNPKLKLASLFVIGAALLGEIQSPQKADPIRRPRSSGASLGEVAPRAERHGGGPLAGRPAHLGARPTSRHILIPTPHPRCAAFPDRPFWERRDLQAEIRAMARRGFIPVAKTDPEARELVDFAWQPAGWRAYAFLVAPKGTLQVRLNHPNEGWFRLIMFNQWGQLEAGMLGNLIPTGNPEVRYVSPREEFHFVYVLVDDPGWMSTKDNPYRLEITRSWDPKVQVPGELAPVEGIWAQLDREKLQPPASN